MSHLLFGTVETNHNHQGLAGYNVLDGFGKVTLHNLAGPTRRPHAEVDADARDPANTARMSYGEMNGDRTRDEDLRLVDYLIRNYHTTPIEMIECWIEYTIPIFVTRQFHRHRTQTINEISARYTVLPEAYYIPPFPGAKPTRNKQGQDDTLPPSIAQAYRNDLRANCSDSYAKYLHYLELGVAPEHSRLFLHVNHYTQYMAKVDLHNLFSFLALRLDSHAQIEAQVCAKAVALLVARYLPELMELFERHRTF